VYQEPLCRRHFGSVLSAAALFRVGTFVAAVVLSFMMAFATGGFWKKVSHDVSQPLVHYSGDALLILESTVPGQEHVWTTSPALSGALATNRLSAAVQVGARARGGGCSCLAAARPPAAVSVLSVWPRMQHAHRWASRTGTRMASPT
jgi:hypothetical protein